MEAILKFSMAHPFGSAVLVVGGALCWLFWLFLALAVHEKAKKNEMASFFRRCIPAFMVLAPAALLGLLLWMLFTGESGKPQEVLELPRYSMKSLCYVDENGEAQPLPDGKYALYRKYASGTTVGFGIVMAKPEGLRTYPLDASGTPLVEAQPQDAYSMVAYGVHSLPSFAGLLLSHDAPDETWMDSNVLREPYIDATAGSQAFPFLYVEVSDGKGIVKTARLTSENSGSCLVLYGTCAEPVVASLVLQGFSPDHIGKTISSIYPHVFLNGTMPFAMLSDAHMEEGQQ